MMKEKDNILVKTRENTNIGRQIRFTDVEEINKMKDVVKSYIYEAIEIEKIIKAYPNDKPLTLNDTKLS